jgi:hypothetical protein
MTEAEIERTAKRAHEVDRRYCMVSGLAVPPPWDEAPPWEHDMIVKCVRSEINKLESDEASANRILSSLSSEEMRHLLFETTIKECYAGRWPKMK